MFVGVQEKIRRIEEDLARTQVNKKTEHHIAVLKARLAKLRRQEETRTTRSGSAAGYDVKRSGDATVVIIGLPSVGKSSLLNQLTNAKSKVGAYQFTTLNVVPGLMHYKGARIQILDMPGIIEGAAAGKGMGRKVLSVARSADLLIFLVDVFQPYASSILMKEVRELGLRPNETPLDMLVEKTDNGGITVTGHTTISKELVKDILREYGYLNARVSLRGEVTVDQLLDHLAGNRVYVPALRVMNKIDLVNPEFVSQVEAASGQDFIPVSAEAGMNIETLKNSLYGALDFIRIYLKPKGGKTDFLEPLILRNHDTVLDVCNKLHRQMKDDFRYAMLWGKSAKFPGQKVGLTHHLADEDVLTLVTA
jgi:small GTP-binding protein